MSQLFSQTQSQTLSQSQAQQQDPTWTTVPLAKFSHITSAPGVKSFVWTHVHRDDLALVFRTARLLNHEGNLVNCFLMEVNAGANLLESQDLRDLVKISKEFIPSPGVDRPVDIVIRCPFLAMRYPKSHISVRRIQVKFRNDDDFNIAVNVLKDLGLSLTDNVAPRSVVTPAPALPLTSSTYSFGSMTGSISRPASVMPSVSSTSNRSFGTALSSPVVPEPKASPAVSSSTLSDFNTRSNSTNPVKTRPQAGTRGIPNSAASVIRPSSTSALVPKNSLYFQQMNMEIRPVPLSSSPDTISRTMSTSPYFNKDAFGALTGNIEDPFSQSQPHRTSFKFKVPEKRYSPFSTETVYVSPTKQRQNRPSSLVRMVPSSPQFSITDDPFSQLNQQKTAPFDSMVPPRRVLPFPAEPLSQVIHGQDRSVSVDYILPPRRTLPFPIEKESQKRSRDSTPTACMGCNKRKAKCDGKEPCELCSKSGQKCEYFQVRVPYHLSALGTELVAPPESPVKKPLPAPLVEEGSLTPTHKPAKRRVASRILPPARTLTQPASKIKDQRVEEPPSIAAKTTFANSGPSSAKAELQLKAAPVKKRATATNRPTSANKRSKMVNGGTQTRTLSGTEHTALQHAPSLSNNPGLVDSQTATPSSPESPPDSYLNDVEIQVEKYKSRPPPRELWQAPGYEEASEEERNNMLNNFICDNLEDPGFLQLCEDTDKAWRLVGLGI